MNSHTCDSRSPDDEAHHNEAGCEALKPETYSQKAERCSSLSPAPFEH